MYPLRLPRVYPIIDTSALARHGLEPGVFAEALLAAGARLLQFRHKMFFDRDAFALLERIAESCAAYGATLIVNDRADLARAVGAGCHVGQHDLPPSSVRPILGEAMLGFSTHSRDQLLRGDAEPVDYLAFGPIFATASKDAPDPTVGLDGLAKARTLTRKPLVAIGGITRGNARAVLAAGADSLAVIGDLMAGAPTAAAVQSRMEEWLQVTK